MGTASLDAPALLQRELDDIADRAEARAAGEPSLPHLTLMRQLIDPLTSAALVADNDGRFVAANQRAAELTGYPLPELGRLSLWQITPNSKDHEAEALWRAFLQRREQSGEYQMLTKDRRLITANYAARTDVLPGLHLSLLRPR